MLAFENKYWQINVDPVRRVLRAKRTKERIGDVSELEKVFTDIGNAMNTVPRAEYGLLLDLRDGPLRNDEAFETAVRKHTGHLINGWRKTAMLVRSAVGELQISRQSRETGVDQHVFRDEAEALRFVEA